MGDVRRDPTDRHDVSALVSAFYRRAFADKLLGPIFIGIAHMNLESHTPVICDFWETVFFGAGLYRRNALQPHLDLHAKVPMEAVHFERWLFLWVATVDEHYAGQRAELTKAQANRIAQSIHRRLRGRTGSGFETIIARENEPANIAPGP